MVPWLAKQEGCQALPQLRRQLRVLGLPGKHRVCKRDRDSPESRRPSARWGLPREKPPLPEQPAVHTSMLCYCDPLQPISGGNPCAPPYRLSP